GVAVHGAGVGWAADASVVCLHDAVPSCQLAGTSSSFVAGVASAVHPDLRVVDVERAVAVGGYVDWYAADGHGGVDVDVCGAGCVGVGGDGAGGGGAGVGAGAAGGRAEAG